MYKSGWIVPNAFLCDQSVTCAMQCLLITIIMWRTGIVSCHFQAELTQKQSHFFHVQRRLLRIFRCNSNCFFVCEQLLKTIPNFFHNSLCLVGEVLLYYLLVLKRTPSIPKLLHLFTFCWCLRIFVGYCSSCCTWSVLWVVMEFTIAMACFPLLFITVDLVMIDIWLYI